MAILRTTTERLVSLTARQLRVVSGIALILVLAACSSQGAREAEIAAQEAAEVAAQQEAARAEQELARQRAAEMERQRQAEARLQAQREREAAAERARAEAEARAREEAERRERQRLAEIAAAEAERQSKLNRIAELEAQIAALSARTERDDESAALLREAIFAAETLLTALVDEQAKYDNVVDGNTVEPLAKERLAELEQRRDELVQRANQ